MRNANIFHCLINRLVNLVAGGISGQSNQGCVIKGPPAGKRAGADILLGHIAHKPAQASKFRYRISTSNSNFSMRCIALTQHCVNEGGLACATGAKDANKFPPFDQEVDIFKQMFFFAFNAYRNTQALC